MDLLSIDNGMLYWNILSFLILVFVLGKFAWKPMLNAIDERESNIKNSLKEAADARLEAEKLLDEHKRILSESEHKAADMINHAKEIAKKQVDEAKNVAKEEAAKLIDQAKRDIQNQMNSALHSLREEVADLTIKATEKLINANLDEKKSKVIVDEYLQDLSNKN